MENYPSPSSQIIHYSFQLSHLHGHKDSCRLHCLISLHHVSLTISSWCRAIDAGHLTNYPHLTSKQVIKHIPETTAMLNSQTDQTHANNQPNQPQNYEATTASSLTQASVPEPALNTDFFVTQDSHTTPDTFRLPGRKTHFLFAAIHDSKGQIFNDKN